MTRVAISLCVFLAVVVSLALAKKELNFKAIESLVQTLGKNIAHQEDRHGGSRADVFVTIKNGTLKGYTGVSTNNSRTIYKYRRIPYAKPPVGPLRFHPPQPFLDGFGDEIWDATEAATPCAQFITSLGPSDEDCLYLSVYTPKAPEDTSELLPVMYFIHGGGFAFGDSVLYGPARLLQQDVVYVTVHYRLGALGFLSTGDGVVPGNNGMKDIVQGLRWVQENIDAFGGDPNQVTVFGESAGAVAATLILISPMSNGLFHRVIAQSGTPLTAWGMDIHPWLSAQKYAERLNCPTDTSTRLVHCLREKPWRELAEASFWQLVSNVANLHLNFDTTTPVIEPDFPGAFLTKDPLVIMRDGPIPDVPVMIGAVQHEASAILGAAYSLNWQAKGLTDDPYWVREEMLPTLLKALGPDEIETSGAPITTGIALAFLPSPMPDNFTEVIDGTVDMLTVALFKAPIQRTADFLSRRLSNVYLYSMEYYGFNTLWTFLFDLLSAIGGTTPPPIKHGMMHADDLQYLFTLPSIITGKDKQFSDKLVKIWTDMAKTGNPTPTPSADIPDWPRYQISNPQYYRLALQPRAEYNYPSSWRKGYSDMDS